jgi:hypothetical protein
MAGHVTPLESSAAAMADHVTPLESSAAAMVDRVTPLESSAAAMIGQPTLYYFWPRFPPFFSHGEVIVRPL